MSFDDWKTITFGEFVAIQRGHDLPDQNRRSGNVPILGSFGITGYHDTVKAKGAGVTIGRSGSSFGVAAYTDEDYWPLNTALYVTDFKGNYPKFVYYFMKLFDFSSFNSGTAQASLNRNNLYPVSINIPSPRTQREIADFFSALDNRISLLRETNITLEAIAQTLFKSWFVDFDPVKAKTEGRLPEGMDEATAALFPSEFEESSLGLIPKGWAFEELETLCNFQKGCSYKGAGLTLNKGAFMFNLGCFNAPRIYAFENIKRYTGEYKSRHIVQSGDLIIANTDMTQNRDILGRPLIIPNGYETAFISHHVFKVEVKQKTLRNFLFFSFGTTTFRERAVGYATGTTVLALPRDALERHRLIIPSSEVLDAFNGLASPILDSIQENQRSIQTLTTLRDTLLPRLISGQLCLNQTQEIMDEVGG